MKAMIVWIQSIPRGSRAGLGCPKAKEKASLSRRLGDLVARGEEGGRNFLRHRRHRLGRRIKGSRCCRLWVGRGGLTRVWERRNRCMETSMHRPAVMTHAEKVFVNFVTFVLDSHRFLPRV